MHSEELTEKHSFINDKVFQLKMTALIGKRFLKNMLSPPKKFKNQQKLIDEPIIAFSESDLWNPFDNKDNWILTAGKIENLRIASKKLNGLEVKANEVFSFWKHIGNPNFGQGYVIGREIREGCVVPTIAGGLCQLSNALYDAASKANFDIIERHKHTKVIKGSLAEQDRDATVKWNYIDLRFKSSFDFRINIELTSDKLILSFKSKQKNTKPTDTSFELRNTHKLNDCYSCGNFACFKHPDRTSKKQEAAITTFILDEKWVEFDNYVTSISTPSDNFIIPLKKNRFIKSERYSWKALNLGKVYSTTFEGIYRAVKLRLASKKNNNVFELMLKLDKQIAKKAVQHIPLSSTHLVISQNLLPFIYETGALGGRTFDVLMTRLPFKKLHERLDFAFSKHTESPTLKDFRVSKELIELENQALTKAQKIITTHSEIAEIFKNKVEKLSWQLPTISSNTQRKGNKVLFPASALGRKGGYEIKKLTKELNLNLVISGRAIEKDDFWEDLKIESFDGNYDQISLVVYPTYIEHQPRQILKAIAMGIPVITTTACGLDPSDNIKVFSLNDMDIMKSEIQKILITTS
ncbi:VanW family protein [Bernardetia sp. OM2101]|uniref:VanW family protein n=1 Tax=Bernardetia sp. OM2101 TaxID=3344876 RepID=UPI0035CFCB99